MLDLQSHSTFSDGELPPAQVVAAAVDALSPGDPLGAEAERALIALGWARK